jgi:hypothetical protein
MKKADGVFMWVVLVVQMLRQEFQRGNVLAIRQRVGALPSKLSTLFGDMLTRDQDNMEDLLLCIQWILFSQQPLMSREFFFAMHSGPHRQDPEILEAWVPSVVTMEDMDNFVSSSSKDLTEVTTSDNPTVQFIRESVKDFLVKD